MNKPIVCFGILCILAACSGRAGSTVPQTPLAPVAESIAKPAIAGDGAYPAARLVAIRGTLYGTTQSGGAFGDGTVFSLTPSGTEHVLYSFKGGTDGANPVAGLYPLGGTLYGTTQNGGLGYGTVFSISTSGAETVLHSFSGGSDGAFPAARLVALNGTLYGTTTDGGLGHGTVFRITTGGAERVLYSFNGGAGGEYPEASLFPLNGALYGTTRDGGYIYCNCGTVFAVTPAGVKTVLHRFGNNDGQSPIANLFALNGVLYGTTKYGTIGARLVLGTVFRIGASGGERVLYDFAGAADGEIPAAGLEAVGDTLYGTTLYGGADKRCLSKKFPSTGCGVVFSITPSGVKKVLHDFESGLDGAIPAAGLFVLNGTLYGTTQYGGKGPCRGSIVATGCGTVYSITTSGAEKVLYRFQGP